MNLVLFVDGSLLLFSFPIVCAGKAVIANGALPSNMYVAAFAQAGSPHAIKTLLEVTVLL